MEILIAMAAAAAADAADAAAAAIKKSINTSVKSDVCFFYTLEIKGKTPCSEFIIGKAKHNINLGELMKRPDCLHNEDVYEWKLKNDGWANNYTSVRSREIFDCHHIKYVEIVDDIEFDIKILFMSLKCGELLIPSIIKSDNQIISIINRHFSIFNNIANSVYHNYRINMMCREIESGSLMDLRYNGHPACKTPLYNYQRDSIQWAINLESEMQFIEFTEHRLFDLGNVLKLYFDINLSGNDDCFIRYGELPKVHIKGGIIADETGLGKTVQALSLALSNISIRTLIIVKNENNLKEHWQQEMTKHFEGNPFEGLVVVKTFDECNQMNNTDLQTFQRIIIDEIAELYAMARAENHKLFKRLCELQNFQYRWGISATPLLDDDAMFNVIKFLIGTNKFHNQSIGKYIMIQEGFKKFFRKNIKANVQSEISLPKVDIHNIGLVFSQHERAILDAMESDLTYSINERLKIISNAMLELSDNDKSVITVDELKRLTVQRFQEKIADAEGNLKHFQDSLSNVKLKIQELINADAHMLECGNSVINANSLQLKIINEFQERERHLKIEIQTAILILERRKTVHDNYLRITQNIADILKTIEHNKEQQTVECDDDMMDTDDMFDEGKMCPICYKGFTDTIVLFVKCRHYYCQLCFEKCHKHRPNTCPMCRTIAEIGEINFIGIENKMITSTKNTEILRLLHSKTTERFIIFTRFDKFINPLVNFLEMNDIKAMSFDNFLAAPASIQDKTRVIMLSANINASGADMSYIHNVIIVEPFDNYIYGKEIEKQLIGRAHRINQKYPVDVYRIYIRDTIEEDIYALG